MVTGRRAFEGRSQASLIASVLERHPPAMSELQPMTPPALSRVVRTCLEKNPDHRFHTAHDLWLQLQWIEEGGSAAGLPAPVAIHRKRRDQALFAGIGVLVAVLAAAGAWALKPAPAVHNVVTRFSMMLPEGQGFTRGGRRVVAISPDGTRLAYVANSQIYLRKMDELEAQPIRGTDVDPLEIMFSPDGNSIAFFAPVGGALDGALLKKVTITGGAPVTLCQAGPPYGARWQGDRVVFSIGSQILAVPQTGGVPQTLAAAAEGSGEILAHPQLLDDGRALLYTVRAANTEFDDAQIVIQPLPAGPRRVLVEGGTDPRVTDSGHLLWMRDSILMAQPFDRGALALRGGPVPIVESLRQTPFSGVGHLALSDTGTLAYLPGASEGRRNLVWVDRRGTESPTGAPPQLYTYPRLSPDGSKIVANTTDTNESDIWIWDLTRKTSTKLTQGPEAEGYGVWSPDSRDVFFVSGASNTGPGDLFRRAADGTGTVERLTDTPDREVPMMILPDGRVLIRLSPVSGGATRMVIWSAGTADKLVPVFSDAVPPQVNAEVSPDGRWIAYQSSEGSTRDEIHVRPFPNTDSGHWQISTGGGTRPMWSTSGRELFYGTPTPNRLMVVAVEANRPGDPFTYSPPTSLLDISKYSLGLIGRAFHISRDDQRFLMVLPITAVAGENPSITIVTHWIEELKARVK
jgi:serine/threonine-protein kinase